MSFFLKSITAFRPINLFIILLLEILLHNIIVQTLNKYKIVAELDYFSLFLLIAFSLVLTTSGYLINDIKDYDADKINGKNKSQVDFWGTKHNANKMYYLLIALSFLLSVLLASRLHKWQYLWISPVMIYLLWLYSAKLKNHYFIGNIGVSIFGSLIMLLVWLAENIAIAQIPDLLAYQTLMNTFLVYGLFAFLTTWLRELIKDAEDKEGDLQSNIITFPVKYGLNATNIYAVLLGCLILFLSIFTFVSIIYLMDNFQVLISIFGIFMPLLIIILKCKQAKSKANYSKISLLLKFLMLMGIILLISF